MDDKLRKKRKVLFCQFLVLRKIWQWGNVLDHMSNKKSANTWEQTGSEVAIKNLFQIRAMCTGRNNAEDFTAAWG